MQHTEKQHTGFDMSNGMKGENVKGMGKKVMLVDDHPIVREAIAQLIEQDSSIKVCGWASNAAQAMSLLEKSKPDLAVVDISLEGTNGIELIKCMLSTSPDLPVLALSMHDENLYAERVFRAGGKGYIMKQAEPEDVMTAIRTVLQGKLYFSASIQTRMWERMRTGAVQPQKSPVEGLTDRELEVFQLIGRGTKTSSIAEALRISIKTVETYRSNIKEKLGLSNGTELVRHAVEWVKENET
ncbi:MAG TPA: response regulator transcription factor [Candidatus Saccharimonadales bacterium]|nr:response regulator transcription factor [Candidatus Saccharimonadales bacterium]